MSFVVAQDLSRLVDDGALSYPYSTRGQCVTAAVLHVVSVWVFSPVLNC